MPILRHDGLWGQGNDLRVAKADDHRGDGGMIIEGLAIGALAGETVGTVERFGRKGVGPIQRHQQLVAKDPQGGQHVVLFKAFKDLHKDRIEMAWCDRIEQRADLIVTGDPLDAQQGLSIIVSFGGLQPALILQKRRRLGEKDTKGTQGSILHGVSGVRSLAAGVRQCSDLSMQDALEGIEAERIGHDSLLGAVERVTLPLSVSIGNPNPLQVKLRIAALV
jgi:hypothetical protein